MTTADDLPQTRIDKWLWAARFFKHRTAATEAVEGGKVRLNGITVKPARAVKPGDRIDLTRDEGACTLIVRAIAERHGAPVILDEAVLGGLRVRVIFAADAKA